MFDPRTLCSSALFFHPLAHSAAGLLMRAPLPKGFPLPADRLTPGRLEQAQHLPVSNAHFLLLEDDTPEVILSFLTAWEQGPPHRHLAFWIPRRFAGKPAERTAARLINGMLVPDDPELVSGQLSDHFKRPATWAELRAVLDFFQGAGDDEAVLASANVSKFFEDHGGRGPARAQFFRLQHQCLQALLAHHRDALLEKNLAVLVFARRESLLVDRADRAQWLPLARALKAAVVPVARVDEPGRRRFIVHQPLGAAPRGEDVPAWIREADAAWNRVPAGSGDTP
ncbi:hypothetical protein KKD52_03745 [Myxococcota bacterium]|nr:hypothetical protein [Myxococcota bacterium]